MSKSDTKKITLRKTVVETTEVSMAQAMEMIGLHYTVRMLSEPKGATQGFVTFAWGSENPSLAETPVAVRKSGDSYSVQLVTSSLSGLAKWKLDQLGLSAEAFVGLGWGDKDDDGNLTGSSSVIAPRQVVDTLRACLEAEGVVGKPCPDYKPKKRANNSQSNLKNDASSEGDDVLNNMSN